MEKKTEHITEELIMRYIERGMSPDEIKKFERILSQNDYIQRRVNTLQSIVELNPLRTPPKDIHNRILSDLDLQKNPKRPFLEGFINRFFDLFERRPVVLGSTLSVFAIILTIIMINIYQVSSYSNYDNQNIADESIDLENEKIDEEDLPDTQY